MRKLKLYNKDKSENIDFNSDDYLVSDISGLGSTFEIKEIEGRTYSYIPKFENISLQVNFGINGNPYTSYKAFTDFVTRNTEDYLILGYDYGTGERYTDVYIQSLPKSQIEKTIISETLVLKRMTSWYENVRVAFNSFYPVYIENNSPFDIAIDIEVENGLSGYTADFYFFTSDNIQQRIQLYATNNDSVIIKSSEKKAYFPDATTLKNAYPYINKSYQTFFYAVKKDTSRFLGSDGTNGFISYKKWIMD